MLHAFAHARTSQRQREDGRIRTRQTGYEARRSSQSCSCSAARPPNGFSEEYKSKPAEERRQIYRLLQLVEFTFSSMDNSKSTFVAQISF